MNRTTPALLLTAVGLVAAALPTLTGGQASGVGRVHVPSAQSASSVPSPAAFGGHATNRYFPLDPGTVAVLRGRDGRARFRERVVVTHRTKRIQGVRTRVVSDVLHRLDGSLAEKTRDWYATDDAGRVWYFGEATATYDRRGKLIDRQGSWRAGVDGAVAGTIMPAHPRPTKAFRQEFRKGAAEDQAWIVQRDARVTTPAGRYHRAVRTFEWSRLESDVVSTKFYARGVGLVLERDVAGGHEVFKLVAFHRP
ncbi:MAG: hypothetical protein JWO11_139 [Nocardioides sp.]|nr:hypothetical protein [Nocardioides sp.]